MLPENSRNRQSGDQSLPNKLSPNTHAFGGSEHKCLVVGDLRQMREVEEETPA
jgi:hypothetical protein